MAKQLLVVDDDPSLLVALATCLRVGGYEVAAAQNPAEALALAALKAPDLVISDVRMPGMDGYQLAHRLRDLPHTTGVPVVLMTAYSDETNPPRERSPNVTALLAKPFEPEELIKVVAGVLEEGG